MKASLRDEWNRSAFVAEMMRGGGQGGMVMGGDHRWPRHVLGAADRHAVYVRRTHVLMAEVNTRVYLYAVTRDERRHERTRRWLEQQRADERLERMRG